MYRKNLSNFWKKTGKVKTAMVLKREFIRGEKCLIKEKPLCIIR